jgi:hypothetical protein
MSTTLDKNPTFAVSSSGVQTFKLPEYLCPVHGVTKNGCVSLWDGDKSEGDYCMTCYKDMIRKFCQQVTPV